MFSPQIYLGVLFARNLVRDRLAVADKLALSAAEGATLYPIRITQYEKAIPRLPREIETNYLIGTNELLKEPRICLTWIVIWVIVNIRQSGKFLKIAINTRVRSNIKADSR